MVHGHSEVSTEEELVSDPDEEFFSGDLGVGYRVKIFFQRYGWFEGLVTKVQQSRGQVKLLIKYEDGECETWTHADHDQYKAEELVDVGCVGYRFIRKFRGVSYFSGRVIRILDRGKLRCKFDEDDLDTNDLKEVQRCSQLKVILDEQCESEVAESLEDEGSDAFSDATDDGVNDDQDSNNEQYKDDDVAVDTEKLMSSEQRKLSFGRENPGKFGKVLERLGQGQSISDRIAELESRRTARYEFRHAIIYPREVLRKDSNTSILMVAR